MKRWLKAELHAYTRESGLTLPGSSDVHLLEQLGFAYSLIYPEKEAVSVLDAIKCGKVQVVTRPLPAALMIWFSCRVLEGNARGAVGGLESWRRAFSSGGARRYLRRRDGQFAVSAFRRRKSARTLEK